MPGACARSTRPWPQEGVTRARQVPPPRGDTPKRTTGGTLARRPRPPAMRAVARCLLLLRRGGGRHAELRSDRVEERLARADRAADRGAVRAAEDAAGGTRQAALEQAGRDVLL